MKAELEPLEGKYYGTVIRITDGALAGRRIELWFASDEPSRREIESWGFTQEQWDQNEVVDNDFGCPAPVRDVVDIGDGHYECKETLRVAEAFIKTLESL